MGVVDGAGHRGRRRRRVRRHPPRADRRGRSRAPGRCATSCGSSAGARDFRLLLDHLRRCRRWRPAACSPASTTSPRDVLGQHGRVDDPVRLLRRPGAAADAGVGGGRRAGRQEARATSPRRWSCAAGALARGRRAGRPAGRGRSPRPALVGVGYAGCQVFPLAMLPDAAAVDARRTGENRAGVYTGVWTAGETLGLALGPGALRAGARARRLRVVDRRRRRPARTRRVTAIVLGFSVLPAALVAAQPVRGCARYTLDARRGRRTADHGGGRMTDVARPAARRCRPRDLPVHGGRTLAYVYDSGLRRGRRGSAARRWRRTPAPTGSTRPRSRACCRWRTTWSASRCGLLDAPDTRGRHGDLRRHRVGPARRAGRPRRPPGRRPAADGAADHRARGVPQGRALLRRRGGAGAGRRRTSAPTPPRWPRPIDEPHGAGGRPARRRTPTASSTRSPRSRRPPRRAGSAATSTRASAAGCCRTPRGSAAPVPPWTFAVEGVT